MTTTQPTPESVLTGALWGLDFADPECDNLARALLRRSPTLASAIALGLAWQRASAAAEALGWDFEGVGLSEGCWRASACERDTGKPTVAYVDIDGPTPEAALIALAEALEARRGEWRHGAMHGIGVKSGPNDGRRCRCTTPTPDSSSPCGRLLEDDDLPGVERPCGWPVSGAVHSRQHPHQPTRCTCGHPIERTDR